tara:strand:- start:14 stop:613 length:600 start_codon:yes stop_codon:yes gene_type:complete
MITFKQMREACWSGFKQVGMKKKGKKLVPNCVPEEDQIEDAPANAAGGGGVAGIGVGADGEPGIRPDAANKYKKKNKDEFKKRIMTFLNRFKTIKEEQEMRASEIASQASNDSELYRRQIQPIIKNLGRKKFKGVYNKDLAVKLFRYAVDNKVKEIAQTKNMSSRMIPGTVRNDAASQLLSSFSSEIDEFAQELKKKSA